MTYYEIQEHMLSSEITFLRSTIPMLESEYHKEQCRDKIAWLEDRLARLDAAHNPRWLQRRHRDAGRR